MIHELKIRETWFDRVAAGEKRAEVRKHDRDFQVGDALRLVRVGSYGNPTYRFVERDERGRFVNQHVEVPPIDVRVTHVLPAAQADGLTEGYCLLSVEVIA
ncbi:hypothetical protein GCM10009718_32930 [Isoptericola halotolerans]|uniref:DUF3850 domain-containing protein n=1 Tax=Isoptericola halotolerans TaxID=300560 RepID=A0ABX2A6A7_9MICO|nr:DUF3850 domain-containing protein [Isoptericola halotolerans]NOV98181.1 hypothetical protein [Isoptericola halotolerans]